MIHLYILLLDFPRQLTIPIPEAIPYPEGKYTPPTVPIIQGYYPYNMFLQQGKVYLWCACGMSDTSPFCNATCNKAMTRNRPIYFNVSESGYYKMCQCKLSANAPFCNGTHKDQLKHFAFTNRGKFEIFGQALLQVALQKGEVSLIPQAHQR